MHWHTRDLLPNATCVNMLLLESFMCDRGAILWQTMPGWLFWTRSYCWASLCCLDDAFLHMAMQQYHVTNAWLRWACDPDLHILWFDTNATHSWGVSCVTEALCCTLVPLFWDLLSVLHGLSLYCRSSQPWSKQWRQLAVADRYIRLWALQVVRLFFTTKTIVSLGRWDVVGSFARISLRTMSEWNAHYLGCSPPL